MWHLNPIGDNPVSHGIEPTEHGRSRWHAYDVLYVSSVIIQATLGEPVDIRCLCHQTTVGAQGIKTLLIDGDEENVSTHLIFDGGGFLRMLRRLMVLPGEAHPSPYTTREEHGPKPLGNGSPRHGFKLHGTDLSQRMCSALFSNAYLAAAITTACVYVYQDYKDDASF